MDFNLNRISAEKVFKTENFLSFDQIICAEVTKEFLKLIPNKKKDCNFCVGFSVQRHYTVTAKHFLKNSDFRSGSILKYFRVLNPMNIQKETSIADLIKIANEIPKAINKDILLHEFKLLQLEVTNLNLDFKVKRTDVFWQENILSVPSPGNSQSLKYPELAKLFKCCISLPHSNADVEKNFSTSGRLLTAENASMNSHMVNARLCISATVKQVYHCKPELIEFDKSLMELGRSASKFYNLYLQKKKEEGTRQLQAEQRLQEKLKLEKQTN